MKEHSPGAIKVTMPSATMMGRRSFTPGVTDKFLPNSARPSPGNWPASFRAEIQALIDEGVPYVQLDAPKLTLSIWTSNAGSECASLVSTPTRRWMRRSPPTTLLYKTCTEKE